MIRKHRSTYATAAILLLLIEIAIARWVNDSFVRPYLGDYLVVILIYATLMACTKLPIRTGLIATLLFAYAVESAQYFNVVGLLGLEKIKVARIIIGTSFSWMDMVCYTLSIITVWFIERTFKQR